MRTKSIKLWAILLILFMCITTMTLFGFIASQSLKKNIELQYKQESQSVLNRTVTSFESSFNAVEKFLEQIEQTFIMQPKMTTEELGLLFNTYQNIMPSNSSLIYGHINGHLYTGNNLVVPNDFSPIKREWYKKAIVNKEGINWTEPYLDYFNQNIVITASQYVNGQNHDGVIGIDFKLNELSKIISNSMIGEDGFVLLLNQNGTVIANGDNYLIGETLFDEQYNLLIEESRKSYVSYSIDEQQYLLHSYQLRQNGMNIVTAISKDELDAKLIQNLFPILVAGVICILIFSIIGYGITLLWTRPLKKLGILMNHVENGNYQVRANVKSYQEVTRLAKGFNSMIRAIKKRDRELIFSNSELKRTEEQLRSKYDELKESQRVLKLSEEKVAHLASHDSLTGLLNRRRLNEELNKSIINYKDCPIAVIFIDLDNFKMINDTLGHSFGDQLIIKVAEMLKNISPPYKQVARISGDEFILIIHDVESEKQAGEIAKEIVELFDTGIAIDSKILNVTASIGVALYPKHALTAEDLLKTADMAMYRAKGSGKNGYRLFDESIQQEIEEKTVIESGIRNSLETNGLELHFQPLYSTNHNKITSIEALLRVKSPDLMKFGIQKIIQIAEVTGQIIEIDNWVLENACRAIIRINKQLLDPVKISVNISPVHIMQQDFVENVRGIVENTGIPPEWLQLEITETSLMKSFETNLKKLELLKQLGISIHLDDFGTGYSSLSYLNSLPIDRVKIDKSFVDMMLKSEKERRIIETIISLAHNIGLQVVAEGVEYKEQLEMLIKYNCELVQGYYISKPLNYEQIAVRLLEEDVTSIN
ncbi:bifunctional diguanylate cyclase/phosphodiesterase [Ureibacillus manganicus]|uniref:bifunctional diguanylate cyclase/phosphodiesterase n=1 Tax=Ureibacillus manganicus TaxID=1266064 RepID=UPI0009DF330A|nr:EAL domain-containing protein [Ureibacillus manganicus]